MRHALSLLALSFTLALTGCAKEEAPPADAESKQSVTEAAAAVAPETAAAPASPPKALGVLTEEDKARLEDTIASSFGKGTFESDNGVNYTFTMEGSVLSDQSGYGRFRFYSFEDGGKMDVSGEMACVRIDSAERRIWLSGRITQNNSTLDQYKSGQYAVGGYVQYRARPNALDGQTPGGIEIPQFVGRADAEGFCAKGEWSEDALYDLGDNDLIAAIP
ncbi:MAG: hypothetical protein AAF465_07365 [Pseudomonadota bacterium]